MGRSALLADSQGNLRGDRGSYLMFTCLPCRKRSEAIHHLPDQVARPQESRRAARAGSLRAVVRGTRTPAVPRTSRLYSVARRRSPVGFGRQHILARPVGHATATTSTSAVVMAEEPVTYDDLPEEHKKRYDEIKV